MNRCNYIYIYYYDNMRKSTENLLFLANYVFIKTSTVAIEAKI